MECQEVNTRENIKVQQKGANKSLKVFQYTNSKGKKVQIRKDNARLYKDGGSQGEHFNAGEAGKKLDQHHNVIKN